jgi:rare lipoprotein A
VVERGIASWYGDRFQGRKTASGEIFDKNAWVMATRHLPLGVRVRIRYNGRECIVRMIDRGPYIPGRLYDVSEAVARYLGFLEQGLAEVEVAVLNDPPANGD